VRTFLLPLFAAKHLGQRLDQSFLTNRDGLEAEEVYDRLPWRRRLLPPYLSLVSIPSWLSANQRREDTSIYRKKSLGNAEKARFILSTLLRSLRRALRRAAPRGGGRSVWDNYMSANSYSDAEFSSKEAFCSQALEELQPGNVLDVGSNTGHFSRQAARAGASVVSIDYDPVVIGSLWKAAREEDLEILPLVVNLARPTPATGWRNQECSSFLDRARGRFDLVLMLAVIHHMLVTERVPLAEILGLAAELTKDAVVVEYVDPSDSMFRILTRGREDLHRDLTPGSFEEACKKRFDIVRSHPLAGGGRRLYLLRKRPGI
jgi:SAM-dependent methyltransferase